MSGNFELIDLETIVFKEKNLCEWEQEFTVLIHGIHMTNIEAQKLLSKVNDAYHVAYNCYNELLINCNKAEEVFNKKKQSAIQQKINSLKDEGIARLPSKDTLEDLVLSGNSELQRYHGHYLILDTIKTFFENNKIKLEKTMQLISSLAYMVRTSDNLHNKAGEPQL